MRRRTIITSVVMIGGLVVPALAVRLYMDWPSENRLTSVENVDLRSLRAVPQNGFLACPPDYCVIPAAGSPVFDMPVEQLAGLWRSVVARQPRTLAVEADPAGRRFVWIQHSALFRFPDIVTVEFVPLGPDRSSLAIYSRSRYGRGDFGVNRRRVENWLAELERAAGPS